MNSSALPVRVAGHPGCARSPRPPAVPPTAEFYRAPSGSGDGSGGFVPRPFSNHTFKFWDQGEYAVSVGFTAALFTFGVALVLLAVLCCCGVCASCCARCDLCCCCACSDARAPRRRRVAVASVASDGQPKRHRCSFFCPTPRSPPPPPPPHCFLTTALLVRRLPK